MAENKSSLSGSHSYEELSEYWDTHSLADHWDQTSPAEFELDVNCGNPRVAAKIS
jgi:hypothetical protein